MDINLIVASVFMALFTSALVYINYQAGKTGIYKNGTSPYSRIWGYSVSKQDNPKKFSDAVLFTWLLAGLGGFITIVLLYYILTS